MNTLLVRADASLSIGTGHVTRCLALAQAWQDAGGQATFAMASDAPALTARLEAEGMRVVRMDVPAGSVDDATLTIAHARALGARWVVADGYHFTSDYQWAIKNSGLDLLSVDDNGDANHFYADLVLNQNLHADEGLYVNREPYTRLLLGTRYALLRREFLKWREWKREIPEVARKVLATLGGSDPNNVTLQVIQALQQVKADGLEAVVVVGASNPHRQEIQAATRASRFPMRLESNATNMPELMAWADVAISGGGSTCWELAFMGLPSIVVVLAENQKHVGEQLEANGIAVNLGKSEQITPDGIARALDGLVTDATERSTMSRRGRDLVDGEGGVRVIRSLLEANGLTLRRATEDDCPLVWQWANDSEVRAVSFSTDPIPWEQHVQWFVSKLTDTQCFFFLAMNEAKQPIGQIRFDVEDNAAIVSVSLVCQARGKGYGSHLIRLASQQMFETTKVRALHAYIKPVNVASVRAFEKAGFVNCGRALFGNHPATHLVLEKNELH